MPDSESGQDRSIAAQGERLARVETKIEGIEKGIDVIRTTGHATHGEMQKFVGLEAQCVTILASIREQTAHLPEIVAKVAGLEGKVASFDDLKPRIATLIEENISRKGGWKVIVMACTAAMGAVTMIGMIGAGVIWFLGKVVGH